MTSPGTAETRLPSDNPFAAPSDLPFGLPRFADIRIEHYRPAYLAGTAEHLAEIDAIVADPEPATFDNTIVAMERAGRLLQRVLYLFFNLSSSDSTDEMQALESELAPQYAAHNDAIKLNPELFARIDAVHAGRQQAGLSEEQIALVERYHTDFVLAGARLDEAGRARLRELNQQIAALGTTFTQNLLKDTEASALLLDSADELAGASPDAIAAAGAAAAKRGADGKYLITLILPSNQPLLASLTDRDVRARLYEASVNRASAGEYDNAPVAAQIAQLRAEAAQLLGFATHADQAVADQTAKSSAAVDEMLGKLVGPAMANAAKEAEQLAEIADRDGISLEPWDWAYYSNKVAQERYRVDAAALRPYFELDRVLHDGVFFAAEQLYGITFTPRPDLSAYHPQVRVWEVSDADGSAIGLYLGDYFTRDTKRGGAWMSCFVEQNALHDEKSVVVNNLNIPKAPEGQPTLLTLDEVGTLFHEFGHALHGLFSDVTYPRLSGTNVPRDFVEFPSQVNEMWVQWPEILENYAVHHETGEKLPVEQVAAIKAAELWGQGFATAEYLGATLLDQAWHRIAAGEEIDDAADFEAVALESAGVANDLIPPRYRTTYFQHIFAGDGGYSAGYYSYIWSEVLDADTVEWFKANGGLTRANGEAFRRKLLSVGGSKDPVGAFSDVVGHAPDIGPLLRRRGLEQS
ncbi:M3 family metallopeptidase [Nakamurella lactea]|uniref:M3 family metallopeptidase n=1 Tax=Nakamurella lactea TaxID=459515 RepID=UPI0004057B72|nr:M3 family metallopeptidase [Nakamurella lactea]